MVDKDYCCSSYLALRTIEKDNVNFFEGLDHKNATITPLADRIQVGSAEEIDAELQKVFDSLQGKKLSWPPICPEATPTPSVSWAANSSAPSLSALSTMQKSTT